MMEKYEIEIVYFGDNFWFESAIGTLTGLPFDEIKPHTSKITRWTGQSFVKVFRQLGFNTNTRWIKFERDSKYPCMMRCRKPGVKNNWYGFVYYDGYIYIPGEKTGMSWNLWNRLYPNYKVTSMLQVWIDLDSVINENTDK